MKFWSTRNTKNKFNLSQAILQGLAADGGLFIPEYFPSAIQLANLDFPKFAKQVLAEYFLTDQLSKHLTEICDEAFNFPLVIKSLDSNLQVLELFHGPSLSFKDFGARFLAKCLGYLNSAELKTIVVATSGDTGSAVAKAFYANPNINVVVLYPKDQISKHQETQITALGDNILSLAVIGTFDDCQKLVKEAAQDKWWQSHAHFTSANSINIARLLAQITYYAYTAHNYFNTQKQKINLIIPSGNLGNATGAIWARAMGYPINKISLATNANLTLSEYIQTGTYRVCKSVSTLANAMDVGNPSNFERINHLFPTHNSLKTQIEILSVSDYAIIDAIKTAYAKYNYIICPHTACAYHMAQQSGYTDSLIIATANPAKFENIIEPILNLKLSLPNELLLKPKLSPQIAPNLSELTRALTKYFPKYYNNR